MHYEGRVNTVEALMYEKQGKSRRPASTEWELSAKWIQKIGTGWWGKQIRQFGEFCVLSNTAWCWLNLCRPLSQPAFQDIVSNCPRVPAALYCIFKPIIPIKLTALAIDCLCVLVDLYHCGLWMGCYDLFKGSAVYLVSQGFLKRTRLDSWYYYRFRVKLLLIYAMPSRPTLLIFYSVMAQPYKVWVFLWYPCWQN